MRARLETRRDRPRSGRPPAGKRHKIDQRLGQDAVAQILAEYQAGTATPALAKRYNISTTAVKRLLHLNGVPLRRYHRLSEDDALTAAELYQAGWSLAKLGRKFDVDSDTVRRRLVQLAVPLRGARTPRSPGGPSLGG